MKEVIERWAEFTRADLNTAICYIQSVHDPAMSWSIVKHFHDRMRNDEPYDQDMLHLFMKHVFQRMVDGDTAANGKRIKLTADQAFGFKLRKGQGNIKDTLSRDLKATACMILLMRRKMRWQDAKGHAANILFPDGAGEKAVERAYEAYSGSLNGVPDETLLGILHPFSLPS